MDRMSDAPFREILADVRRFAETASDLVSLQEFTVRRIAENLPSYNWVGFYMVDRNDSGVLVLGPFRGAPTEHVRIPVARGICGAAVAQGQTIMVDDVASDPRYLACSVETQSEIVVPVRVNDEIVGEIDVDSHARGAFGPRDREFLERCAVIIGGFIEVHRI